MGWVGALGGGQEGGTRSAGRSGAARGCQRGLCGALTTPHPPQQPPQIPWAKIEAERHNKERTPQEHARRVAGLLRRDRKRAAAIAAAGIDYEYDGLAAALPGKAKRIKFLD